MKDAAVAAELEILTAALNRVRPDWQLPERFFEQRRELTSGSGAWHASSCCRRRPRGVAHCPAGDGAWTTHACSCTSAGSTRSAAIPAQSTSAPASLSPAASNTAAGCAAATAVTTARDVATEPVLRPQPKPHCPDLWWTRP